MATWRQFKDIPDFESPRLSIFVGRYDAGQYFFVPENIITRVSDFFAAAVKKGWREAEEHCVQLPDDHCETFQIFQAFLHTGRIFTRKEAGAAGENVLKDREWYFLADLWAFGEKIQSVPFKEAVVDAVKEKMATDKRHPTKMHEIVYAHSCPPSRMRKLLVDIAIWFWKQEKLTEFKFDDEWNQFFKDLAVKQQSFLAGGRPKQRPWESAPACDYHEHGTKAPCYKTMFPF